MSFSSTDGAFCVYNSNANDPVNIYIDIQGYFTSSATGASSYTPVPPVRICDTRSTIGGALLRDVTSGVTGQCDNSGNPVGASSTLTSSTLTSSTLTSSTLTVNIPSSLNIPSNATAIVVNVVIVGATSGGYATVYNGGTRPSTSNLNWGAASDYPPCNTPSTSGNTPKIACKIPNISNMVVVPISQSTSSFSIYSSSSANVVVDVYGYYSPAS